MIPHSSVYVDGFTGMRGLDSRSPNEACIDYTQFMISVTCTQPAGQGKKLTNRLTESAVSEKRGKSSTR